MNITAIDLLEASSTDQLTASKGPLAHPTHTFPAGGQS